MKTRQKVDLLILTLSKKSYSEKSEKNFFVWGIKEKQKQRKLKNTFKGNAMCCGDLYTGKEKKFCLFASMSSFYVCCGGRAYNNVRKNKDEKVFNLSLKVSLTSELVCVCVCVCEICARDKKFLFNNFFLARYISWMYDKMKPMKV
jgi:hypothetical protein